MTRAYNRFIYLLLQLLQVLQQKQKLSVMTSHPYFPHLGEAHPWASGLEVVQLLLVNVHLNHIPASDCGLQQQHVLHWRPQCA